jgi:hypothetical protein
LDDETYPVPYDSNAQKYFSVELKQKGAKTAGKNCFKESESICLGNLDKFTID